MAVGGLLPAMCARQQMTRGMPVPANSLVCDPVVTTLEVGEHGYSDTQTFTDIPRDEDTVTLRNTTGDGNTVLIYVNNRSFMVTLQDGEEASINVASALKKGNNNVFSLTALGAPGSSVEVMFWDGLGAIWAGRGWEPAHQGWRDLITRLKRPAS